MRSSLVRFLADVFLQSFVGRPGACGRVTLSVTMASGVGGGGVLIGCLALTGFVDPGVHLFAAQALFVVGSVLGLAHGLVLAVAGRPGGLTIGGACWRAALGAVVCVPALVVSWLITAGMTLSAAVLTSWKISWLAAALVSWSVGLALCWWAWLEASQAVKRALSRWAPDFGVASGLAVVLVGLLGGTLFWRPPEALGFDLRFAPVVAVVVGLLVACSFGLPLVCGLHAIARRVVGGAGEAASEPAPSRAG